ncbi:sterile alpha motif domain-containing protein 13-like [Lethenteron reissneri]|uniref:sterile alpha motif domain-containing protein 13-like n=1 Tax=Lethenteron reissneri TaxID=7753 RepID=UPI002AB7EDFF|nr:sterile alpha motif domain-containing protein 13-like [Lethenteron reissneri]
MLSSGKPSPPPAPATPREDTEHTAEVPEVRGASCLPTPSASPSPASQGDAERSPPHHNGAEGLKLLEPADWSIADVVSYFRTAGFEEEARAFQEQEIDGKSLLLMKRSDVLTGLSIKLGPALKIYEFHVKALQSHHFHNDASY